MNHFKLFIAIVKFMDSYYLKFCIYCIDMLKKEPKNVDLLRIFAGCEHKYKLIGDSLEVMVTDIRYDAAVPKNTLISVFERWRARNKDVTWKRIMQVCDNFPGQFGRVKSKLEEYLSSVETHEKYLDNHEGSLGIIVFREISYYKHFH